MQNQQLKDCQIFVALLYSDNTLLSSLKSQLSEKLGNTILESDTENWDYSKYYSNEMGNELNRVYWGFEKLICPSDIVTIKRYTMTIEDIYSIDNKRKINIDPGYITPIKMVLATHKDNSRRVYIANGIYGDPSLRFVKGSYELLPGAYPDYSSDIAVEFFNELRKKYLEIWKKD
jgi:hypothetical protein